MNDNEIVKRILDGGDSSCFALIVRRHSAMVFARALSVTHDEDLAADITQETFIKAYSQLDAWAGGTSLAPWLSVISLHLSINLMDKRRRRGEVETPVDLPDEDYQPEREEMIERIRQEVEALPDEERRIVKPFYYDNKKTSDIARAMHLTEANVLVRLHRIRLRIKKRINDNDNE